MQDEECKVQTVTDYLNQITGIRNKLIAEGRSDNLFFRGQSNSTWEIRPSVFRDSLLSVEDLIIQRAIARAPYEFANSSAIEELTKLQHYGLPTRLLDVTMNPLVALYFACATENNSSATDEEIPDGVVFFCTGYGEYSNAEDIKILASLAKIKIDGNITLQQLAEKLGIKDQKNALNFISQLQRHVFVMPHYSNSRIISQSGAFLLTGAINVTENETDLWQSKVQKSVCNLNSIFAETILIDGKEKQNILNELDFLNINEGSLFPELEHQMSHIKHTGIKGIQESIPEFIKFEVLKQMNVVEDTEKEDLYFTPSKQEIHKIIERYIKNKELEEQVYQIIERNTIYPDWNIKAAVLSSMQLSIRKLLQKQEIGMAKEIAHSIVRQVAEMDYI